MREEAVNRDRDLEIGPTPRVAGHSSGPRSGALQGVVLDAKTLAIGDVEPRAPVLHLNDVVSDHAVHRSSLVAAGPLASPTIPLDDCCRPLAMQSVLIDRICLLCGLGRHPRVQHRHGWLQRPNHACDADDLGDRRGAPRPALSRSPERSSARRHRADRARQGAALCPLKRRSPARWPGCRGRLWHPHGGVNHTLRACRHPHQCHPVKPTVAWRFELPRTAP